MLTSFPYKGNTKVLHLKPTFHLSTHLWSNLFCFAKLLQDMLSLQVCQGWAIGDGEQGAFNLTRALDSPF